MSQSCSLIDCFTSTKSVKWTCLQLCFSVKNKSNVNIEICLLLTLIKSVISFACCGLCCVQDSESAFHSSCDDLCIELVYYGWQGFQIQELTNHRGHCRRHHYLNHHYCLTTTTVVFVVVIITPNHHYCLSTTTVVCRRQHYPHRHCYPAHQHYRDHHHHYHRIVIIIKLVIVVTV